MLLRFSAFIFKVASQRIPCFISLSGLEKNEKIYVLDSVYKRENIFIDNFFRRFFPISTRSMMALVLSVVYFLDVPTEMFLMLSTCELPTFKHHIQDLTAFFEIHLVRKQISFTAFFCLGAGYIFWKMFKAAFFHCFLILQDCFNTLKGP